MRQVDGGFHYFRAAQSLVILLTALLWMTGFAQTPAAAHLHDNSVIGLRIGTVTVENDKALRVVIETRNPAATRLTLLRDPYRLVVDMPDTDWQVNGVALRGALAKPPALAYRFGTPEPGIGRVVIELDAPAIPVRRFALPPDGGGHRFVLDLVDRGTTAFSVAARALAQEATDQAAASQTAVAQNAVTAPANPAPTTDASTTKPVPKPATAPSAPASDVKAKPAVTIAAPSSKPRKWVVFIDAGHGGKDPGAIGHSKTQEKHITLAAALELARQLGSTGIVEPVLSRDDDRYLRLRDRIRLAREQSADVFISLHADAAPSSKAYGMSVFTLSDTASDKEAALLAERENKADLIGGPDLAVEDPDAAGELLRMFQRESMNQSTYLASAILKQIGDLPGGTKRGHRFAGFAVLKAPDMPSVLVEMGFVTNRRDEANLKKESYRRKVVERLARAIIAYLVEYGPRR